MFKEVRQIWAGEVVFNWRVPQGRMTDPKWDIAIGSDTSDPREVAMHEFGHAIRLDHDDVNFDDDVSIFPTGSRSKAQGVIVRKGGDGKLQTWRIGDDGIVAGDLTAGADGVADSGKKRNAMTTRGVRRQHGINPLFGFPPDSAYSYTDREPETAIAAKKDKIIFLAKLNIGADPRRYQNWDALVLYDANDNEVARFQPGQVGNGIANDFRVEQIPPADHFEARLTASSTELPGVFTTVTVYGYLGAPSEGVSDNLRVFVPLSINHPVLTVVANWWQDTIVIADGVSVLCAGELSRFQPVDCSNDFANPSFLNMGFINARLTSMLSGDPDCTDADAYRPRRRWDRRSVR